MFLFFLKGVIISFAIAAPVGPTAVLCVNRTVKYGWRVGLLSGLGAATADALYALIAGFGVNFIIDFVFRHEQAIRFYGGLFLLYWGTRIILQKFVESDPLVKGEGLGGPFVSTFILTLTNPMTLLAFMAVLAILGKAGIRHDYFNLAQWIVGVAVGSFGWWIVLCSTAHFYRKKFDKKGLWLLNRATGIFIIAVGALALLNLKG